MDYVATECQQPHDSDNKLDEQKSLAAVMYETTASPTLAIPDGVPMPSTAAVRRCDICGHPLKGHPRPRGKNCQQIPLRNAQSREAKNRDRHKTERAKAQRIERQKTLKEKREIFEQEEKTKDKIYTCIKEEFADEIKTEMDNEAFYPFVSLGNNTVDVLKDEKDSIVKMEADSFQFMQTDLQFVECKTEDHVNETHLKDFAKPTLDDDEEFPDEIECQFIQKNVMMDGSIKTIDFIMCNQCPRLFRTKTLLWNHKKTKHNDVHTRTPQAAFVKETKSIGENSSQIKKILSSYKNIMPKPT